MKNYIQPGNSITIPAPVAVLSGDVVAVGALIGIAATDAASGEDVAISTRGVYELPKAAEILNIGDAVEIDGSGAVTVLDAGNQIGVVVKPAAAGDATARVRIG